MPLSIKNDEAHRLAEELAHLTGESLTQAVTEAIRQRLERESRKRERSGIARKRSGIARKLVSIGRRCSFRPLTDSRTPDEILYDKDGLP